MFYFVQRLKLRSIISDKYKSVNDTECICIMYIYICRILCQFVFIDTYANQCMAKISIKYQLKRLVSSEDTVSQRVGPSPALVNSATASGDHAYTYVLLM